MKKEDKLAIGMVLYAATVLAVMIVLVKTLA
jgi:hypothetical protein